MHFEYFEVLEQLDDKDFRLVLDAMKLYVETGEIANLPNHLKFGFIFIKNRLESEKEKWNQVKNLRAEAGKKGGRPKSEEAAEVDFVEIKGEEGQKEEKQTKAKKANESKKSNCFSEKQTKAKKPVFVSVSVSDNDIYPPPIPPQGDSDAGGDIRSSITDYEPDETDSDFDKPEYVAAPSLPPKPKQQPKQRSSDEMFSVFWDAYPKKISKKDALKAFRALKVTDALFVRILDGLEKHKASYQWLKNGGEYIPHPATFLRQERWKDFDEISDSVTISQKPSEGLHQRSSPLKVRNKKYLAEPFLDPELEARLIARRAKQEQEQSKCSSDRRKT